MWPNKTSHLTADRSLSLSERCVNSTCSTASELSGFLVSGWWTRRSAKKMKAQTIVLAATLLIHAWISPAHSQTIQGSTEGVFLNPDGADGAVVSGTETSQIVWGTPNNADTTASSLTYQGLPFQMNLDERRAIGLVTYKNGRTVSGTTIESVDVSITFDLTLPSGQQLIHPFTLGIDTTPNTSNEEANSDSLRLLTPYSGLEIADGGEIYAIRLFFGQVGLNAVGEPEQVILLEDAEVTVPLDAIACTTIPLDNTSSALIFEDVSGEQDLVLTGEGTNEIATGTPSGASGAASVYTVLPASINTPRTEIPFVAGTLRYFNGTVTTGTSADRATLRIDLGGQLGEFDFPLQFITTTNNSNARESADIIQVSNPIASRVVNIAGIPHTARLAFSNPTTGGFTNVSEFAVEESQSAEAEIVVVVTRFLPQDRPFALSISKLTDNRVLLSWPSQIGTTYQLESSTGLQVFSPLGESITASNTSTLVTRDISKSKDFYRVRRLP